MIAPVGKIVVIGIIANIGAIMTAITITITASTREKSHRPEQ